MNHDEQALILHKKWRGKIRVETACPLSTKEDLSLAYTPGVAAPCLEIAEDREKSYLYTRRGNLVAVVTDGSAVLGLGNIGPEAGMPVMEGKCALFKAFADVDAFPLCIRSNDVDEIVRTVELLAGSFGGINLEDIAAPRCFEIERRLKEKLDIPVFHDDQHGTAIVVLAAMINALKLVGKKLSEIKVVVNGAGAAGIACTKLLMLYGLRNVTVCDRAGVIFSDMSGLNEEQRRLAERTNPEGRTGSLADAIVGADVFLGFSAPACLTKEMARMMKDNAIIFACANPTPEIFPEDAKAGGARIVGTGRSDYPNQINNVLVFPGLFRGALDAKANAITDKMKIAAAEAIAALIEKDALHEEMIIPSPFDQRVAAAVAGAVVEAAGIL